MRDGGNQPCQALEDQVALVPPKPKLLLGDGIELGVLAGPRRIRQVGHSRSSSSMLAEPAVSRLHHQQAIDVPRARRRRPASGRTGSSSS